MTIEASGLDYLASLTRMQMTYAYQKKDAFAWYLPIFLVSILLVERFQILEIQFILYGIDCTIDSACLDLHAEYILA